MNDIVFSKLGGLDLSQRGQSRSRLSISTVSNFFYLNFLLFLDLAQEIVDFLRLQDSYTRFVKTWIRFANPWIRTVSWITNPDFKRFVSYRGSRILTLKDLF